jgi:hypothetical protein
MYPPNFPQEMPYQSPASPQLERSPGYVVGTYECMVYNDPDQWAISTGPDRQKDIAEIRRQVRLHRILLLVLFIGLIGLGCWVAFR